MSKGKITREALAEAVADLRAEVAALRAENAALRGHGPCCLRAHCNWGHCGCYTVHGYAAPGCAPYYPVQIWCGTVSSSGTGVSGLSAAAGCAPAPQVLTFSSGN